MKKWLSIFLIATLALSSILFHINKAEAITFPDVKDDNDYKEAIYNLANLGIINGYPEGTFKPAQNVNRAEAAKMMFTFLGYKKKEDEKVSVAPFSDVKVDHWAAVEISKMKELKIIDGTGDNKYDPDNTLNRAEMAKILAETLKLPDAKTTHPFKDVEKGKWYDQYVAKLYENDLTNGKKATEYAPLDPVTRQEFAKFLDNVLKKYDFKIVDIAKVDGQIIDNMKFKYVLANHKDDISDIYNYDIKSDAYFDLDTWAFHNLSPGNYIFEVLLDSEEKSTYLKLIVDQNFNVQYQFKTPSYLRSEATALNGTKQLAKILNQLADEYSEDINLFEYYLQVEEDDAVHYFTYIDEGICYFEFENTNPFHIIYDFTDGSTGKILISPTKKSTGYDYSATLIE